MSFYENKLMHLLKLIGLSCVLVKLKGMNLNIEVFPKMISISDQFAQAYRNSKVTCDFVYDTKITRSSTICKCKCAHHSKLTN